MEPIFQFLKKRDTQLIRKCSSRNPCFSGTYFSMEIKTAVKDCYLSKGRNPCFSGTYFSITMFEYDIIDIKES